ncbi:agmatinase [Parachlamydia acanthamoebae]|uniref:agmatinase n=1 Tax=Parachlamydia acanthamoebae TaxID=83552 RepID=UPI0007511201|nr:agmatinase [Parachlamydia acanthamoebae]
MQSKHPIGQGIGVAGRYVGLPDPYGQLSGAEIVILPVPFDLTSTYQKGSDKGPAALIEASRNMELYDIETDSEVYKKGIYTDQPIQAKTSQDMLQQTHERTKTLLSHNKFVVTLGGEHSISYAPIRAHAEHFGSISVLQFDAHADLQDAYEDDPWSHASVMARVKEIPQVDKIVSVGIRSMSSEELPNLDPPNTFFAHTLDDNKHWIDQVLSKLSDQVYITFDLDAFDSSLMSSTGTPEPGGLQWNQATQLLKKVAKHKKIVGFDVVELCPNPANLSCDFLAAKLIYKLLSYTFYSNRL